ncbi:hypothetical protein FN846DRAFT_979998 [Sphaerosporella brunnea]|uniref:Uncharacterized protein n=1 Tax=Sphaerosporella brunnea TaxID=1250544 RepID=A0A5J5EDA6_9PEZI|nr:hypothetical protein FN846DRAFT_979998 [Sphaerosporella brunnea]
MRIARQFCGSGASVCAAAVLVAGLKLTAATHFSVPRSSAVPASSEKGILIRMGYCECALNKLIEPQSGDLDTAGGALPLAAMRWRKQRGEGEDR